MIEILISNLHYVKSKVILNWRRTGQTDDPTGGNLNHMTHRFDCHSGFYLLPGSDDGGTMTATRIRTFASIVPATWWVNTYIIIYSRYSSEHTRDIHSLISKDYVWCEYTFLKNSCRPSLRSIHALEESKRNISLLNAIIMHHQGQNASSIPVHCVGTIR